MTRRYAKGKKAWGICQRSGKRVPYDDLVEDGYIKGLLVARDWYEPPHPQDTPVSVSDPVGLYRPSPEEDFVYTQAECACDPDPGFTEDAHLLGGLIDGSTSVAIDTPLLVYSNRKVLIQRDDMTWFCGEAVVPIRCTPTQSIPLTQPFTGTASAGAKVFVGDQSNLIFGASVSPTSVSIETSPDTDNAATLTVTAVGGCPPYLYQWEWVTQPDPLITIDSTTTAATNIDVGALADGSYSGVLRVTVSDTANTPNSAVFDIPVNITVFEQVYQYSYFTAGNWSTSQFSDPLFIDGYRDTAVFSPAGSQNEESQAWLDKDSEADPTYHLFCRNTSTNVIYGFRARAREITEPVKEIGWINPPELAFQRTQFSAVDEFGDPDTTQLDRAGAAWIASGNGIYVIAPHVNFSASREIVRSYACPFGSTVFSKTVQSSTFPTGYWWNAHGVYYIAAHGKFYTVLSRSAIGGAAYDVLYFASSTDGVTWTVDRTVDNGLGISWTIGSTISRYRGDALFLNAYVVGQNTGRLFYQDPATGTWLDTPTSDSVARRAMCQAPDGYYLMNGNTTLERHATLNDINTAAESWTVTGLFIVTSIAYNPQDPANIIMMVGLSNVSPNPVQARPFDLATRTTGFVYSQPANYAGSATHIVPPKIFGE